MPYLTKEQIDSGVFDDYIKNEYPKQNPAEHKSNWDYNPEHRKLFGKTTKEQDVYAPVTQEQQEKDKAVVPERGIIGDIGSNIARGISDAAKMGGYAIKSLDPDSGLEILDPVGQKLIDLSKKADTFDIMKPDVSEASGEEGFIKRGIMGGFRAAPLSAAAMGVGIVAATVAPAIGVGAVTAGAVSTLGLFGLGTYGQKYQEFKDQGIEDGEAQKAAVYSGIVEGGFEALASYAGLKIFGADKFIGQPLKTSVKELLSTPIEEWGKRWAADAILAEMPTEMIQEALGTEIETGLGLQGEGAWKRAAVEAIIPALTMSVLFGAGSAGMSTVQKRKLKSDLNNLEDPEARAKAVGDIEKGITENEAKDEDGEITKNAEAWANMALDKIDAGEEISLNQDFVSYASQDEDTLNTLREGVSEDESTKYAQKLKQRIDNLSRFSKRTPRQQTALSNYQDELESFINDIRSKDDAATAKAESEAEGAKFEKDIRGQRSTRPKATSVMGGEADQFDKFLTENAPENRARIRNQAQMEALESPGVPVSQGQKELDQGVAEFRRLKQQEQEVEYLKQALTNKEVPRAEVQAVTDRVNQLEQGFAERAGRARQEETPILESGEQEDPRIVKPKTEKTWLKKRQDELAERLGGKEELLGKDYIPPVKEGEYGGKLKERQSADTVIVEDQEVLDVMQSHKRKHI